jgi:hypothetical protein
VGVLDYRSPEPEPQPTDEINVWPLFWFGIAVFGSLFILALISNLAGN